MLPEWFLRGAPTPFFRGPVDKSHPRKIKINGSNLACIKIFIPVRLINNILYGLAYLGIQLHTNSGNNFACRIILIIIVNVDSMKKSYNI